MQFNFVQIMLFFDQQSGLRDENKIEWLINEFVFGNYIRDAQYNQIIESLIGIASDERFD